MSADDRSCTYTIFRPTPSEGAAAAVTPRRHEVQGGGLEPPRALAHETLILTRLPVTPSLQAGTADQRRGTLIIIHRNVKLSKKLG